MSLTKKPKPKTKIFFQSWREDLLNLLRFEQLFSTIVGRDILVQKHVQTAGF